MTMIPSENNCKFDIHTGFECDVCGEVVVERRQGHTWDDLFSASDGDYDIPECTNPDCKYIEFCNDHRDFAKRFVRGEISRREMMDVRAAMLYYDGADDISYPKDAWYILMQLIGEEFEAEDATEHDNNDEADPNEIVFS